MVKCFVIDDEKPARDEISYLINKHDNFQVIQSFESGRQLIESISDYEVDVIFIDINMPGINGIEAIELLKSKGMTFKVVFITAFDNHAVKAFELNAMDYILKPVSEDRLNQTLDRLILDTDIDEGKKLGLLLQQLNKGKHEHICFHKDGKLIPVKLNDIIYVKAENKGTLVETKRGVFVSSATLQEFEKKLMDKDFFRCHRSYLINLNYILQIEPWFNRTYQVVLEDVQEPIPISRNYVQHFKDMMNII